MQCEHEWSAAETSPAGAITHTCRKCGFTVTKTIELLPASPPKKRRAKACRHDQWIPRLATLPDAARTTFLTAYSCGLCGEVVGVCQAGDHPFGYPDFRGRTGMTCDWCQSPNPFEKQ